MDKLKHKTAILITCVINIFISCEAIQGRWSLRTDTVKNFTEDLYQKNADKVRQKIQAFHVQDLISQMKKVSISKSHYSKIAITYVMKDETSYTIFFDDIIGVSGFLEYYSIEHCNPLIRYPTKDDQNKIGGEMLTTENGITLFSVTCDKDMAYHLAHSEKAIIANMICSQNGIDKIKSELDKLCSAKSKYTSKDIMDHAHRIIIHIRNSAYSPCTNLFHYRWNCDSFLNSCVNDGILVHFKETEDPKLRRLAECIIVSYPQQTGSLNNVYKIYATH